jgi:hypothetical protein
MKNTYFNLFDVWRWWLHSFDTSSVNLFQAWGLWVHGQLLDTHILWGIKILIWERFGKVLSFVSGIVVVAEIIGYKKFATWGKSLEQINPQNSSRAYVEKTLEWAVTILSLALLTIVILAATLLSYVDAFLRTFPPGTPKWIIRRLERTLELNDRISSKFYEIRGRNTFLFYFNIIISITSAIIGIATVTRLQRSQSDTIMLWSLYNALTVLGWLLVPFFCIPFFIAGIMWQINFLALAIDKFLVRPLEWLLKREDEEVGNVFRVISVLLLLIGFHFDLLGS